MKHSNRKLKRTIIYKTNLFTYAHQKIEKVLKFFVFILKVNSPR
jgi:hypothetical protein